MTRATPDDTRDTGGTDTLQALDGNDTILAQDQSTGYGGAGNDSITTHDDSIAFAGSGNDVLRGSDRSVAFGGDGNDTIDAAHGSAGNDRFYVYDDARAYGGAGSDRIDAMDAAVTYGGEGSDTLSVANSLMGTKLFGDEGNDVLSYASNNVGGEEARLFGGEGDDTLFSQDNGQNYEAMLYTDNDSFFDGGNGNDLMQVVAGGTAVGGEGDDTIVGFTETTLKGGAGRDLFVARTFGEDRPYVYDDTTPEQFDLAYVEDETRRSRSPISPRAPMSCRSTSQVRCRRISTLPTTAPTPWSPCPSPTARATPLRRASCSSG